MNAHDAHLTDQPYVNELAQLYDVAVPDWPGEIEFYCQLIRENSNLARSSVLEIACGTGRVTFQIASTGARIVGIDLSEEMLAFAKAKSDSYPNVQLLQADMRSFELSSHFEMAIVPAYSFQLLLTPSDQNACLERIARHLHPGGTLILHLEEHPESWLASLPTESFTPFERSGKTTHPQTRQRIRVSYAWSFSPHARTLSVMIRYEHLDRFGKTTSRIDRGPLRMHCTSPDELEAQMASAGFKTEAVYGDFYGHPYDSSSEEMIWIARRI